jgi:hypothetical protein
MRQGLWFREVRLGSRGPVGGHSSLVFCLGLIDGPPELFGSGAFLTGEFFHIETWEIHHNLSSSWHAGTRELV